MYESSSIRKILKLMTLKVINDCQTRLDTDDLELWREAGLSIDNKGFIMSSNFDSDHAKDNIVMREDMICNALIWLTSRLINYIAAGETFNPIPAGHREQSLPDDESITIGISQQMLLERWDRIDKELTTWYSGLPETFRPCIKIPHPLSHKGDKHDAPIFSEIWYSIPMCGSAIQNYHMARILLLINKPHESTARRSTVARRLGSYRLIHDEIMHHCREIMYVLGSRSTACTKP